MKSFIIALLVVVFSQSSCVHSKTISISTESPKAVLVTGASSGIGRNIAETLAKNGYFVYAGARKATDLKALSAIENIKGIKLDVTVQSEIDAAVATVKQQGRGLYGLVNNAGVTVFGPLIEVSEKDMQFQMDVNLFGPYRVTKAFAPLIIESKGRITTIGSISGIVSGAFLGPYNMSKYSMEAYTDALASELKKFDVKVSIVEPGNYNSKVLKNMRNRIKEKGSKFNDSLFKEEMMRLEKHMPSDRSNHKSPDEVSAAVVHALFDDHPKTRYMVVPAQEDAKFTISGAMKRIIQLNEKQQYSFDRKELIAMLDAALNQ